MKNKAICDKCPWNEEVLTMKGQNKINKHFWRTLVHFDLYRGWTKDDGFITVIGACVDCPYELEHLMSEGQK